MKQAEHIKTTKWKQTKRENKYKQNKRNQKKKGKKLQKQAHMHKSGLGRCKQRQPKKKKKNIS